MAKFGDDRPSDRAGTALHPEMNTTYWSALNIDAELTLSSTAGRRTYYNTARPKTNTTTCLHY